MSWRPNYPRVEEGEKLGFCVKWVLRKCRKNHVPKEYCEGKYEVINVFGKWVWWVRPNAI